MNVTDEPQKHVKMPNEPLEIDEEDFYVRAFIKWVIEEQPKLKRLAAENAKLRELVLDYEELTAKLCDSRECDGCPFDSERTICEHMRLVARVGELGVDFRDAMWNGGEWTEPFDERMRELGVKV